MQSATIGVAQSHVARSSDADGAPQLVAVRSAVVDTIGHVLGNLFQRIYHLTDQVQTADADTASLRTHNEGGPLRNGD